MAKFIFYNVPTAGHVNPTYGLVKELTQRGHHVIYHLTDAYRQKIEAAGAEFRAYDARIPDDYFERRRLDGSNPTRTAHALATTSLDILPDLLKTIETEQPAAILHDSMCPWGWMAAKVKGLPDISSTTLLVLSPKDMIRVVGVVPIFALGWRMLPDLQKYPSVARAIERQYSVKLPGFADFLNLTGNLTISYTSQLIQPHAERLHSSIKFVGPSIESRPYDADFPWQTLDERPLIYISLGTVINQNVAFYRACIDALINCTYQVVMSIGRSISIESLGSIPENFTVRRFVPQLDLLPRTSVFITHAGMNSVHEGLYYNVPMILVPQQMEQRIVATRIEELGAGIRLGSAIPDVSEIAHAVQQVMDNTSYRQNAARVGESLRTAGGPSRAVDEIERLILSE